MFRTVQLHWKVFNKRNIHTNIYLSYICDIERSAFRRVYDRLPPKKKLSIVGRVREGWHQLKEESLLLANEMRSTFRSNKPHVIPNEESIVWKFDGTEKSLYQWIITCDRDYDLGYSTAQLDLSPTGTGVFHGVLSTQVPKDGKTYRSGFSNITTVRKRKSFKRMDIYDWSDYNTLTLRVRGDGRCYMLNILQREHFDILWYNMYHYVLYTSGGPYWQHVQIPFSKFAFGSKGVLQDEQQPMPEHMVTNFGITVADQKNGPFKLEIDYIGVCLDINHMENFAYEMYDISTF